MVSRTEENVYIISWYEEEDGHAWGHFTPCCELADWPEVPWGGCLPEHPAGINWWALWSAPLESLFLCSIGAQALPAYSASPHLLLAGAADLLSLCQVSKPQGRPAGSHLRTQAKIYICLDCRFSKHADHAGLSCQLCWRPQAHLSVLPEHLLTRRSHQKKGSRARKHVP